MNVNIPEIVLAPTPAVVRRSGEQRMADAGADELAISFGSFDVDGTKEAKNDDAHVRIS